MNRGTIIFSALLACAGIAAASVAHAEIIVSEIMYNPQGTDRDAGVIPNIEREWAEIYNADDVEIDLSGWSFGDSQDGQWGSTFPVGTTLGPRQALVITGDAATFDANWGLGINRIEVDSFPTLANSPSPTNETAAIRDHLGVIQDRANFDSANDWPGIRPLAGRDGMSIFLKPEGLASAANDLGGNWGLSSQGVYGARWVNGGGHGENHGSPGVVVSQSQAPFAPSPDAAWSMVILPDTQNYSKDSIDLPIFSQLTNWIKDNQDEYNVQLVLQEGDIVNQNSSPSITSGDQTAVQQWTNARTAMSVLDGVVPYVMAVGNHDLGATSAQNRDTQFNDYFQASQNPLVDPAQGGILRGYMEPGKLENAYFELHAPDGRDLLVFSLEFWPRQAVVDWANAIAAQSQFQNHTVVLLTHSYMNWNEQRADADPDIYGVGGDSHDGEQLWQELVKLHGNFEMTFNGHIGGDQVGYLQSTGVAGNAVHQMLFNSQFEINGGNGWIRIVEFLEDGHTARVRTYSPFLNMYRTDAANQFEIQLSALFDAPADFNRDGLVNADDLTVWNDRFGTAEASQMQGDANGDGEVDGADFLVWQRALGGASIMSAAAHVPEASGAVLLSMASCSLAIASRSRRRSAN